MAQYTQYAQYREQQARFNRNKIIRSYVYAFLLILVTIGGIIGFFLGRYSVHEKTVTLVETVEVPMTDTTILSSTESVFLYDVPLSESLQRFIYEVCADKGVPVSLVMAMIEHESGFNPEAVSATNDYGLMQINSINYETLVESYRCTDMKDPYQNVFCGITIIGSYIEKYDGDYTKALMSYNMGDYGARKAWSNGVTSTKYSVEVMSLMEEYEEVAHDKQKTGQ